MKMVMMKDRHLPEELVSQIDKDLVELEAIEVLFRKLHQIRICKTYKGWHFKASLKSTPRYKENQAVEVHTLSAQVSQMTMIQINPKTLTTNCKPGRILQINRRARLNHTSQCIELTVAIKKAHRVAKMLWDLCTRWIASLT